MAVLRLALTMLALAVLTGCASDPPYPSRTVGLQDGSSLSPWPADVETSSSSREPRRTRHPAPRPPAPDNELNLPHATIVALGRVADRYGYGLGPGTALDYEQATNFAYAVSLTCDGFRSGGTTLQDAVDQDTAAGAPLGDARGFNRYLDETFCPAYYAAGN